MFRPRVIPVLLLKKQGLVKSIKFKDFRYIGDPINAVKLFNDLKADELVFMDIRASIENRLISLDFVKKVGDEANMPFAVAGGIRSLTDIRNILKAGAEKVILNTWAALNPSFIKEAANEFGSSTICACIDVKRKLIGKQKVYIYSGTKSTEYTPVEFSQTLEGLGVGELIVNSIDQDGTMEGYDLELINSVSSAVSIPVIAMGGAGKYSDFVEAIRDSKASAAAAGSLFIYHGNRKAVLINYPTQQELNLLFSGIYENHS